MSSGMAFPFRRSRANSRSSSPGLEEEDKISHVDNYLRELTNPAAPNIDIVAVHGLNPGGAEHGERTWMKNEVLWLRDEGFLPGRFPNARVLLFGYNSRVATGTSTAGVMDVAIALLNRLVMKRRDDPRRPILFLCHSLGGIIVKQALVRAVHGKSYKSILWSTRAIAFFGTPHRGGNRADLGRILAEIALVMTGSVKNNFMETLQKNSAVAADIHELFKEQAQEYQIVSFYETLQIKPGAGLIVDKVSATLGLPDSTEISVGLAANHSAICKFDRRDSTYEQVIENIANLVQHALQPTRIGTPLLTPSICLTDPENRQRIPSIVSFQSTESFEMPDSTTSSSRSSSRCGMPTFEDIQSGNSHLTTATDDQPALPVIILPYSNNPNFIGRERIFNTIKESLSTTTTGQQRIALCGLGGVGKSQIATRYAYWYRQNFPDHSIFWIHCGTADRFRQGLVDVGTECHVAGIDNRNNNNRLLLLKDWLQRKTNFKWLMILDNADDPTIFRDAQDLGESSQDQVNLSSYIPACEHGSILITTRDPKVGRRLANGRSPLQIKRMSQEEAVLMLRTKLSTKGEEASPITLASPVSYQQPVSDIDLLRLAQSLDYLPLAMVQAASYITENVISISHYEKLFKKDDNSAVTLLQWKIDESGRDSDIPSSLYATWQLSIEQIQEAYPKSAGLIFVMAHYEQLQIPTSLLQHHAGLDVVEFTTIIGVLLRFSLVNRGRDGTYNMHRLVQLIVKGWLVASGAAGEWQSEALRLLSSHFPSGEYDTWIVCASLESHAVKMINTPGMKDADKSLLGTLQINLAWYYSNRGRWGNAEEHARAACSKLQEAYGLRNRETLAAEMKFAQILKQNIKLEEAELVIKQIVDESKALFGSKDKQYFDALDVSALIAQTQGKLTVAEKASRKALSGREKVLGPNHASVSESQRRLATILEFSGNYDQAETLITTALNGRKHLMGTADKTTMNIMQRLGFIRRAQGKYVEAETIGRDLLKLLTDTYGPTHIFTREARYTFASSLVTTGKIEEAEEIFLDLVELIEKEHPFGPDHPYNFFIQNALGGIRTIQGRYAEALEHQSTAWNGLQKTYGKNHAKTWEYQSAYASALMLADASEIDGAMILQQEAYEGLKKIVGEQHPSTLTALLRLSEAHATKQNLDLALKLAEQVQRGRKKRFNPDHPDILVARKWVHELRNMKQVDMGANIDLEKIDSNSSAKKQKIKRSYWGMGPRASSNTTSVETGLDDDASTEKKKSTHVTPGKPEKSSWYSTTKERRKSSSKMFGRHSYGNHDEKIEDNEPEISIKSDSDDDAKGGSLDIEKSPAFTSNSLMRPSMPPRSAVETRSDATTQDSNGHDSMHGARKKTQGQMFQQEGANDSTLRLFRRKEVAPRPSNHPKQTNPESSPEAVELPAEIVVNSAARLNGPGWDDFPFEA